MANKYPYIGHSIDHTTMYNGNNQLVTPPPTSNPAHCSDKKSSVLSSLKATASLCMLMLSFVLLPNIGWGQDCTYTTATIGSSTDNKSFEHSPVHNFFDKGYRQIIYDASELCGDGISCVIHKIAFHYAGSWTMSQKDDVSIYMAEVDRAAFTDDNNWEGFANLTEVYHGSLNCDGNSEWNWFTLNHSFNFSGNKHLIVAIWDNSGDFDAGRNNDTYRNRYGFYSTACTGYKMLYNDYDYSNVTINNPGSGTRTARRPNTKFCVDCHNCTDWDADFHYTTTSASIVAGTSYTNTTLVNNTAYNVSYTISPSMAGVSISSSGEVTTPANIEQTFTVTATIQRGGEYCDKKTTYTLNVGDGCAKTGGMNGTSGYTPFFGQYNHSWCQMLYTASELGNQSCLINKIAFYVSSAVNYDFQTRIYMKLVNKTTFVNERDFVAMSDDDLVWSGTWNTSTTGWNEIELQTPFAYDRDYKLLIGVKWDGRGTSPYPRFQYSSTTGYTTIYAYDNGSEPDISNIGNWGNEGYIRFHPYMKICMDCCTPREGSAQITNTCPINLTYGNTVQLNGTVETGEGTASWTSSNTGVATVDGGLVSPCGIGSTTITYTRANDGNYCETSATCTINVTVPTPTVTQTDDPLPQCNDGDATLVATVTSIPPGYTFHWYRNSDCTDEITSVVSGTNHENLNYDADGGQVWCRLEKPESTDERTFIYNGTTSGSTAGTDGSVQTYTIPEDATSLTLEVWGAQGGSYNDTYVGGRGGYSKGTLTSPVGGSTLYIVVGGQPASYTTIPTNYGAPISGGYNGGGSTVVHYYHSSNNKRGWTLPQAGGGATHIATAPGLLSTLSAQQDNVLIVAGGGSGAVYCYGHTSANVGLEGNIGFSGYAGGGDTGDGYNDNYKGKQNAAGTGGSFGQGANYNSGTADYRYCPAGAGGGWYGGGIYNSHSDTYNENIVHGHGGGSGYIKSTLTNPSPNSGSREGNGQAKITAYSPKITGPAGTVTIQCCGLNATIEFGD